MPRPPQPALPAVDLRRHRVFRPVRSTLILVGDLCLWLVLQAGAIACENLALRLVCAVLAGVLTAMLLIVGHDACHGTMLRSRRLGRIVGQLAFLPALHSFALWHHGHNATHHRYTNRLGSDFAYQPLSPAGYRARSRFGRAWYRLQRHWLGYATYYLVEIWWHRIFWPRAAVVGGYDRQRLAESVLVTAYLGLWVAAAIAWAPGSAVVGVAVGVAVPFATFCAVVSFSIHVHHTHPDVPWFTPEEWDFRRAQLACTAHVRFPRVVELAFHHIFAHTAHHVHQGIPMHGLEGAQRDLEAAHGDAVLQYAWTPARLARITRTCRLYDPRTHTWCDYDGTPLHRVVNPGIRTAARRARPAAGATRRRTAVRPPAPARR